MKKTYTLLFVLAVPAMFLLFTSGILFHNGSPGGKTGSPGDNGANCTGCHSGTPINQEFMIYSAELLVQGYSPGQLYNFFVIAVDDNANKFGFEATAEDASGNKVGTFQAGFLGATQTINNSKAITHTALGNIPVVDSGTIWMFTWTAPPTTVGTITFYAAINAANGNGANSGDQIYLTQFPSSPATGIIDRNENNALGLYPNPSTGIVNMNESMVQSGDKIEVLNIAGQLVYYRTLSAGENKIDLSQLDKGVYFVKLGNRTQRLILH